MTDLRANIDALAERALARPTDTSDRGRRICLECHGSKWVEEDATGQTTVRPCSRCATNAWERWKGGHYMRDHTCEDCQHLQRQAGKASR